MCKSCSPKAFKWISTPEKLTMKACADFIGAKSLKNGSLKFPLCITNLERLRQTSLLLLLLVGCYFILLFSLSCLQILTLFLDMGISVAGKKLASFYFHGFYVRFGVRKKSRSFCKIAISFEATAKLLVTFPTHVIWKDEQIIPVLDQM